MFIIYWFIGHCISSFLYIFVLIWTKFCKLYPFFKIYDQKENAIPEKRKCEANSHYTMLQKQVSIKALISFSLDLLNKQEEEEFKWGSICRIFFDLNVHFNYSGTVLENSMFRSSHHRCSMKKAVLFHRKTPVLESWQVIFGVNKPMACNFIKKETQAQVFSCEFCEISKNTFFYRTPLVAALIA